MCFRENANSIPATFWLILELVRQPHVLSQAREEITASQNHSPPLDKQSFNLDSLRSKPLLQSVYAEVLRLYASNIMMRNAVREDFYLDDWKIPKGSLIAVDGRVAHMDNKLWNIGNTTDKPEGSHHQPPNIVLGPQIPRVPQRPHQRTSAILKIPTITTSLLQAPDPFRSKGIPTPDSPWTVYPGPGSPVEAVRGNARATNSPNSRSSWVSQRLCPRLILSCYGMVMRAGQYWI